MRTARREVDHDVYEEGRDTGPGMGVRRFLHSMGLRCLVDAAPTAMLL